MNHIKIFEEFKDELSPEIRHLFDLTADVQLSFGYHLIGPTENEEKIKEIVSHIESKASETYYDALDAGYGERYALSSEYERYQDLLFRSEAEFKRLGYEIKTP